MTPYRIFADIEVINTLRTIRLAQRKKIAEFFEDLKVSPETPGDYSEKADSGRQFQTKVIGKWAVTYWTDHPVKEVKVEKLARADY